MLNVLKMVCSSASEAALALLLDLANTFTKSPFSRVTGVEPSNSKEALGVDLTRPLKLMVMPL